MGEDAAYRLIWFCFLQCIQLTDGALKGFNGGLRS